MNSSNSIHDHLCEVLNKNVVLVKQLRVCDNFLNFGLVHSLTHVDHCIGEFFDRDFPIMVAVKDLKGINDFLQCIGIWPALSNQLLERRKIKLTTLCWVYLLLHL